jgi:hypothetical protein
VDRGRMHLPGSARRRCRGHKWLLALSCILSDVIALLDWIDITWLRSDMRSTRTLDGSGCAVGTADLHHIVSIRQPAACIQIDNVLDTDRE